MLQHASGIVARRKHASWWRDGRLPRWGAERLDHDGRDYDRAAGERRGTGPLAHRDPDPQRTQGDLEQRDQADLRGGDEARPDGQEHEAEANLDGPQEGEPYDVVASDRAGRGQREERDEQEHLRE